MNKRWIGQHYLVEDFAEENTGTEVIVEIQFENVLQIVWINVHQGDADHVQPFLKPTHKHKHTKKYELEYE